MRNADIAMYDAKRRGRSRIAVFDESMHRRVVDRLAHETELRQVVECALLDIHYQPIVDLATGRIIGLEALARWPQDRPPVPPSRIHPGRRGDRDHRRARPAGAARRAADAGRLASRWPDR